MVNYDGSSSRLGKLLRQDVILDPTPTRGGRGDFSLVCIHGDPFPVDARGDCATGTDFPFVFLVHDKSHSARKPAHHGLRVCVPQHTMACACVRTALTHAQRSLMCAGL